MSATAATPLAVLNGQSASRWIFVPVDCAPDGGVSEAALLSRAPFLYYSAFGVIAGHEVVINSVTFV